TVKTSYVLLLVLCVGTVSPGWMLSPTNLHLHFDSLREVVLCRLDPRPRGDVGELVHDHGTAVGAVVLLPLGQVDVGVRAVLEAGRCAHLAQLYVRELLGLLAVVDQEQDRAKGGAPAAVPLPQRADRRVGSLQDRSGVG